MVMDEPTTSSVTANANGTETSAHALRSTLMAFAVSVVNIRPPLVV
jgi:hypothetical protein